MTQTKTALISKHRFVVSLVVSILSLGLFLTLTNPAQLTIGFLIVPVLLFFAASYSLARITIDNSWLFQKQPRKRRIVAVLSSALITILVILQSTGGISPPDLVLLGLIIAVAALYIDRF